MKSKIERIKREGAVELLDKMISDLVDDITHEENSGFRACPTSYTILDYLLNERRKRYLS